MQGLMDSTQTQWPAHASHRADYMHLVQRQVIDSAGVLMIRQCSQVIFAQKMLLGVQAEDGCAEHQLNPRPNILQY